MLTPAEALRGHELRPYVVARQVGDPHVHDLVVLDEGRELLAAVPGGDVRVTQHAQTHRPQQVRHEIRDRRLRIHHRNIHVPERRSDAVGADEIDVHLGAGAAEVAQDRHGQLHRKARRHLHAQRALRRRALVADVIECVLEPVEGLHHRRQQVLAGLGEREGMRAAVKQLHARQALERNDMARQGALRDEQRIRRGGKAAVFGDAFEGPQRVQRQPAPVDGFLCHRITDPRRPSGASPYSPRVQRPAKRPLFPMLFFDAGSEFLGYARPADCGRLCASKAPPHHECTPRASPAPRPGRSQDRRDQHQPPPAAARPAVPRQLGHQAAHALRRHHRPRHDRRRAHRHRLGRPDARLCRPRALLRRPGPAGARAALPRPFATSTSTTAAAGRSTSRSGTSPARSPASPCWKLLGGLSDRVPRLRLLRHAARSGRAWPRRPSAISRTAFRRSSCASIAATGATTSRRWRRCGRASGDRLELMVDCNQGWRMPWDTEPPWTLQGRAARRARTRAPRRLLDGGAAAPRRPRRHAARCARRSTCASPAAR